ncbi:MAG: biotin-independent malonate decarboxylase subunit beta [Candidatus Muproteobacteria bacterium RBG_16_65_34]|uniref:Biotin-independent malonate decarboxylase subunit beta n=1 Tax=Candidatus Muproteobacteria bacterium RBG_16_65_34 TaxID=1817760 RepID=A0A1F6TSU1_9PROT|nr:MAG: biotin-independent malonate decarboxylase subunit beta [Candidatus Muproteobacteria bacterium RBG_16_65_34]
MTRRPARHSYYEANARQRLRALLDPGSLREFLGPEARATSPHLESLDLPVAFDDGVVVGSGGLGGHAVLVAAQEGGFLGGAVGEVHGAKITGLLERALAERPRAVLLLLESGGVRLHEANAGLIAIAEILRALLALRAAGVASVGLIGGVYGCFGGMGIVACCCDALIMSEPGRLGLSGPEVIETEMGVEEFDARDRALVWRTLGGKHRYLLGEATRLVADDVAAFRGAALELLEHRRPLALETLAAEHARLEERLERYGDCRDAGEIWARLGIAQPQRLPLLDEDEFLAAAAGARRGGT